MNRGDRREALFEDDHDRQRFLETLGEACQKTRWQVQAYCLMDNHFHLVVDKTDNMQITWAGTVKAVSLRAVLGAILCMGTGAARIEAQNGASTVAGWEKYSGNPVLG